MRTNRSSTNGHHGFGLDGTNSNHKPADFDRMLAPFMRVPIKLFQVLTPLSVILLAWLLNFENILKLRFDVNNHFYVDRNRLLDERGMDDDRQAATLQKLAAKHLIQYRLDRANDRWYISLRYKRIVSELQQ